MTSDNLPEITIGSSVFKPSNSEYVVASRTLVPGGTAIVVSATTISLAPSASALVIGDITHALASNPEPTRIVTLGGLPLTPSGTELLVGTQALAPGSAITVSGIPISLAPSATVLVIGTSTIPLEALAGVTSAPRGLPLLTLGGVTITANPQSDFVIGGQTLVLGGSSITVSGTTLSIAPSASEVVIGSTTEALSPTSSPGLAGLIISGLGGTANPSPSISGSVLGTLFEGAGTSERQPLWAVMGEIASVIWILL
ncbi:hypothetical protein MMC15_005687 [Xylographa vitiligo]|nr:hypothetical protein [Xylographa vitiligo]